MQKYIEIFADNGLSNIFDGDLVAQMDKEANRLNHKKVVGFRLENEANNNVRLSCRSREDLRGVYAATVFFSGVRRRGKTGRSNFFPKQWTREQVADAVFQAYQNKTLKNTSENQFVGQAADGMKITFWLNESGKVIDAMPLVEGVSIRKRKRHGSSQFCRQCGKQKYYVCPDHHYFPKKGLRKIYARVRYYARKLYFGMLKANARRRVTF